MLRSSFESYPRVYYPRQGVWELTFACNMNCLHCGSSAGGPVQKRQEELSTKEAFQVCDDLATLGNERITLSGGELFLRKDWDLIAERLTKHGVKVSLISNGSLIGREAERISRLLPLEAVGISLDGAGETHNLIRRVPKAFERAVQALKLLKEMGAYTAVITSVSKLNVAELEGIYKILQELRVNAWQIQLIIGEGRMERSPDLPGPEEVLQVASFMARKRRERKMHIFPGDNIGYYSSHECQIRDFPWLGCFAGILVVGIEANGNVKGCLSQAPDLFEGNPFVEGNVREKSLVRIWTSPDAFSYNRKFDPAQVSGECKGCPHLAKCRCGCTATAYALTKTKYNNPCCLFRFEEAFNCKLL